MVKDRSAIDTTDYKVLEQNRFLQPANSVNPQNPTLRLDLMSRTKYQYSQRVLAERQIQDYKLRPGFMALGLTGAALSFYAANSSAISSTRSTTYTLTLNTMGVLLAGASFLNFKAVGEPRSTGEEKYLRSVGDSVRVDTVHVQQNPDSTPSVTVRYGDLTISEEQGRSINNGQLTIPLAELLEELNLEGSNPGTVGVSVTFEDSLYSYEYPVSAVLQPYANVTARLSPLRNTPDDTTDNIVADLVEGSQLQIKDTSYENWYQVLYGIAEHYVAKDDAEIVWRSSDFSQEEQIETVPRVAFGEVDVENNIPILRGNQPNAIGLVITNENYVSDKERRYAHRDGRLIKTYLQGALGYPEEQIYELQDFSDPAEVNRILSEIRLAANEKSELTVFLSGYGRISQNGESTVSMLGINTDTSGVQSAISFEHILEQVTTITSGQTLIISDLDFSSSSQSVNYSSAEANQLLSSASEVLLNANPQSAVFFSTRLNQPSALYQSAQEDKKHRIFPYFFAKAMQQRNTTLTEINQYLQRNVSYTARKLHDHPQNPLLFGNPTIDLQN